ncbi:glucosyltransferase [Desulfosarcina ovata subsp. sediminis]|uniref:Glucosyltransferase n=1 Tax=Desulfosarcina ovata subsp. sediminis TaxID=885957 RepID=A0A5K7ZXL6_9BACT|nr:glycosyltransferase family 2 protein [Desulfosarcina ovata]BBO84992.1 glucosyltransferase [Desulfosarcina ovata subsp. sediminis]
MTSELLHALSIVHFVALGGLAAYGLHRLWLLWHWWPMRHCRDPKPPDIAGRTRPRVTIQLPFYNERYVAARLIDAAARMRWPTDRLEIQILDDSTDDTSRIVDRCAAFWRASGINARVLRRQNRIAYKAGALSCGLVRAKGDLIAVFDADFLPDEDFLVRTVPYFADPAIGMVQVRWGFLNSSHSWLTRIQALLLGPHFGIEHRVRCHRGCFFNFNGTAGVWRRQAIETAGGWQADTVTEDLDLSYRAQMAGWRFLYLNDYAVPSELPVTLEDFRRQQHRWAKGSIQTARKILPQLLGSTLPVCIKIEATFHLLANLGWLLGALVTLTLYPTILIRSGIGPYQILRLDLPLFLGATLTILAFFFLYASDQRQRERLRCLPLLPIFTIGLAPSLALSVIQGIFQRGGVFDRTPKYGLRDAQRLPEVPIADGQRSTRYLLLNLSGLIYAFLPVWFAWRHETWLAVPFLLVFPSGFTLVILQAGREWWHDRRLRRFQESILEGENREKA